MKDKYIAAKERWVAKQAGRAQRVVRSTDRLPPRQREAANFPVLDMGIQPEVAQADWRLKIHGLVEKPVTLDWEQFMALEQSADTSDFHCVTTWSQYDKEWRGVSFFTLTELVKPKDEVIHVFYKGYDGYSTTTTFDAVMDDDTLIAHTWNGATVPVEPGGPARVIISKLYAWKGAKWAIEIIFLDRDILGFWEVRGYSNTVDPWTDGRFA